MSKTTRRDDDAALERLRLADPVIAALIDANPEFDPDAWLRQLPRMDAFGVLIFQSSASSCWSPSRAACA